MEVCIRVQVKLHSSLRLLLPPEAKGQAELDLPQGSTLADVLEVLGIERRMPVAVNGMIRTDLDYPIGERDQIAVFAPIGGG